MGKERGRMRKRSRSWMVLSEAFCKRESVFLCDKFDDKISTHLSKGL